MKMADFSVDVPLAQAEEENFDDLTELQNTLDSIATVKVNGFLDITNNNNNNSNCFLDPNADDAADGGSSEINKSSSSGDFGENFGEEELSGSLEDLVTSFDQKIAKCFKNYHENTDDVAPVQVRTQEEIMNECQIWWTLTGNFGNILPIDWSKSYARKLHLPTLNLRDKNEVDASTADEGVDCADDEDEDLANALDMHQLIVSSLGPGHDLPPPQSADQVIQEIDEIMQQSSASELTGSSDFTMDSLDSMLSPCRPHCSLLLHPDIENRIRETQALANDRDKLQSLSYSKLQQLQVELESLIQIYNETLVSELALREELEYEKELKNTFISVLLQVQNKRRQFALDRKRLPQQLHKHSIGDASPSSPPNALPPMPQCLTTVIPYNDESGPPDNGQLQALIKILKAVHENNPMVPNLLTEYILTVICPSNEPRLPPKLIN